jgi:hypothetical protein
MTGDDVQLREQSVTSHSSTCSAPESTHVRRSEYCWLGSEMTEQYTPVVKLDNSWPGGAHPGFTDKQPRGDGVIGVVVDTVGEVEVDVAWEVDAKVVVVALSDVVVDPVLVVTTSVVVVEGTVVVAEVVVVCSVVVVETAMVRVTHNPGTHRICAGTGRRGKRPPEEQKPAPDNRPKYAPKLRDAEMAGSSSHTLSQPNGHDQASKPVPKLLHPMRRNSVEFWVGTQYTPFVSARTDTPPWALPSHGNVTLRQ